MGKKGSWFSAIKKVFTPNSKSKLANDSEKKGSKEKKKGLVRRETNSFIPLFREPSSIEKILGDVEREQLVFRPPTPPDRPKTPTFVPPRVASPRVTSPRAASPRVTSPRAASPRVTSPRAVSPTPRPPPPRTASPRIVRQEKERSYCPEPTLRHQHASATKIQATYRGYMARRSFKALKGLVRLQGVVRGQNVKRQTTNAMKYMQLLVRVQSQIQSRRIQNLENQARRQGRNDKGAESTAGKWSTVSGVGNEDWDDSTLTKEEVEARMQKKVEAVVKRERAMAFAYSHQLWKGSPKSAQTALADTRAGGFPWWWNWLERQLPAPANPPEGQTMRRFQFTPPRPFSERKPSPRPQSSSSKQQGFGLDNNFDSMTPKSSKSTLGMTPKQTRPPPFSTRNLPQTSSTSITSKYARARATGSPFDVPMRDDESLTSCPPFSAPSYMAPTVSAKAKARASSNPKERFPGTPNSETKSRRLSFPMMAQGIGGFKWNKGSFFSNKGQNSPRMMDKQSVGDMSVDSTVSLPAGVGRRPFNRFV